MDSAPSRKPASAADDTGLRSEGDVNFSANRQAWSQSLDAESRALLEEDARYFLHQSLSTPCLGVLRACGGATITDWHGRALLDFHGNSAHQVGFGNPKVIEAIVSQMASLPFCPRRYTNVPAIRLAKKLAELAPGDLNRVLFAPGGAEAIGMAMKLARVATGRHKMISMWDAFHGASLDTISISGEALFRRNAGPLLPGCEHVPPADPSHCPFGCAGTCSLKCADYVEYVLEKEGDVAAVVAETIRSVPFIPPPEYWARIRAACDRHGALLILDEIPTGLGRSGRMFACEHYGVVPDMLVLGKGLGGGVLPLAALLAREGLNVAAHQALGHYTHEKSPVACAAGLATIECIESEHLLEHARTMGEYALKGFHELRRRHKLVGDVRGLGLIMGVEVVKDRKTMERAVDEADRVMYKAMSLGLNFKVTMGNVLTLTPPLTVTEGEIDQAIQILDQCLSELE